MKTFNPEEHLIFEGIVGSKLYGTALPDSDTDQRGICVPPKEILLNPFMNFEQKDSGFEEEDRCIYALGQYFKLCADMNPNIVEILFIPESHYLYTSNEWERILDSRDLFLSKKAKYTFSGYAVSQSNKIKRHRRYFTNPLKAKPERSDYGLKDAPTISGDGLQAVANISFDFLNPKFVEEIRAELSYRSAMKEWHDFVSWRDSRNPRRKRLEELWGYDTICASHLLRLMYEGEELLLTGKITFPLNNASDVLKVKQGGYSYDQILNILEGLDILFNEWYDASVLPKAPDRNKLTELYFDIINA
jgi:uncharacterized protein